MSDQLATAGGAKRRGVLGHAAYNLVSELKVQADNKRGNAVQKQERRKRQPSNRKLVNLDTDLSKMVL